VSDSSATSGRRPSAEIDTTVPRSARIWNYWLGGRDDFPVDRAAGDQFREAFPGRIARFFDGLGLVEPGVVPVSRWRPDSSGELPPLVHAYGGVGRKP
jgi:hypothetical protein